MTLQKGISLNWVIDTATCKPTLSADDILALHECGAKMARIDLRLGANTSWSPALLAAYHDVAEVLEAGNIAVLGLLGPGIASGATQDKWNAGNVENGGPGWNPYLDHYLRSARTLVSAFPEITHWEVWNEPNAWSSHTGTVYTGGSFIYPSLYGALIANLYPLVKSIQASSTVVVGGLFAHDNAGVLSRQNSGADYVESIYELLDLTISPPFDAIGMHYYIDQSGPLVPEHLQRYLDMLQDSIAWYEHDPVRPVYVTEAGWTTKSVSPDVQASNLTAFYEVLALNQFVQAGLWFQVRDNPPGSQYYGLCNADGTRKPAFAAFQSVPS